MNKKFIGNKNEYFPCLKQKQDIRAVDRISGYAIKVYHNWNLAVKTLSMPHFDSGDI